MAKLPYSVTGRSGATTRTGALPVRVRRLFEVPGGRTVDLERIHLSGVPMASMLRFRVRPAG
ncbi:hypothetical protein [Actinoplanes sp. NPDC049599]|uniref:hypothetical protein n=1 Tax=Actinoplanes sp. NPDC049599 TaxID=3363903 RepID=UPI00379A2C6A